MTPIGWLIMITSVTCVIGLTWFCLWRVLSLPPVEVEDLNVAPLEIETPDTKEPD
jgi:hypothetical protein